MSPLDPRQLVRPGYWFDGNPLPPTPYSYAVAALFALALAVSLVVWLRRRRLFPGQRIKTRLASRLGPWAVGLAATGLFSALMRLAGVPLLSARIIWLAAFLGLAGLVGYVVWYRRRRYPLEQARLEREELKRRFLPRPRATRRAEKRRR